MARALDILRTSSQRFVVLLDWLMPHGGGTDVLVARANDFPSAGRHAYIVLTADARLSQANIDALHLPSDMSVTLLRKPFSLDDVLHAIEDATSILLAAQNNTPAAAPVPTLDTSSE